MVPDPPLPTHTGPSGLWSPSTPPPRLPWTSVFPSVNRPEQIPRPPADLSHEDYFFSSSTFRSSLLSDFLFLSLFIF